MALAHCFPRKCFIRCALSCCHSWTNACFTHFRTANVRASSWEWSQRNSSHFIGALNFNCQYSLSAALKQRLASWRVMVLSSGFPAIPTALATHLIFLELTHFPRHLQTIICHTKCLSLGCVDIGAKVHFTHFQGTTFLLCMNHTFWFHSINRFKSILLILCEGALSFPIEIVRLPQKLVLSFV